MMLGPPHGPRNMYRARMDALQADSATADRVLVDNISDFGTSEDSPIPLPK